MEVADAIRQLKVDDVFVDFHNTQYRVVEIRHPVEGMPVVKCHELNRFGQFERWRFLAISQVNHIL